MRPYIDRELCSSCGLCVKVCRYDVFVEDDGEVIPLRPEGCIECGSCADECPSRAIAIHD